MAEQNSESREQRRAREAADREQTERAAVEREQAERDRLAAAGPRAGERAPGEPTEAVMASHPVRGEGGLPAHMDITREGHLNLGGEPFHTSDEPAPGVPVEPAVDPERERARAGRISEAVREQAARVEASRTASIDPPRPAPGERAPGDNPNAHRVSVPTRLGDDPERERLTVTGAHAPVPPPLGPADIPLPRAFFLGPSSAMFDNRVEIFASGAMPRAIEPHMLKSSSVTADALGRKVVIAGTVLASDGGTPPMMKPALTADTAYGVLGASADVTDADMEVPVVLGGWLREDRCTDNGVYGTVVAGHKTQLAQIVFRSRDL